MVRRIYCECAHVCVCSVAFRFVFIALIFFSILDVVVGQDRRVCERLLENQHTTRTRWVNCCCLISNKPPPNSNTYCTNLFFLLLLLLFPLCLFNRLRFQFSGRTSINRKTAWSRTECLM